MAWVSFTSPLVLLLASHMGCSIAADIRFRQQMETLKQASKECLSRHRTDPGACQAEKLQFEADLEAYRARRLPQ